LHRVEHVAQDLCQVDIFALDLEVRVLQVRQVEQVADQFELGERPLLGPL